MKMDMKLYMVCVICIPMHIVNVRHELLMIVYPSNLCIAFLELYNKCIIQKK